MLQKKNNGMNMMHDYDNSEIVVRKYLNPCSGLKAMCSTYYVPKRPCQGISLAFFIQNVMFHSFCHLKLEVTHLLYETVLYCVIVTIPKTWLYDFSIMGHHHSFLYL